MTLQKRSKIGKANNKIIAIAGKAIRIKEGIYEKEQNRDREQ